MQLLATLHEVKQVRKNIPHLMCHQYFYSVELKEELYFLRQEVWVDVRRTHYGETQDLWTHLNQSIKLQERLRKVFVEQCYLDEDLILGTI